MDNRELSLLLTRYLASGKVDLHTVLPALSKLLNINNIDKFDTKSLYDALLEFNDPVFDKILNHLQSERIRTAKSSYIQLKQSGPKTVLLNYPELAELPVEHIKTDFDELRIAQNVKEIIDLLHSRFFITINNLEIPGLAENIEKKYYAAVNEFSGNIARWNYLPLESSYLSENQIEVLENEKNIQLQKIIEFFNDDDLNFSKLGELQTFNEFLLKDFILQNFQLAFDAADTSKQKLFVAAVLTMRGDIISEILPELYKSRVMKDYASIGLALRFGLNNVTWNDWMNWLNNVSKKRNQQIELYKKLSEKFVEELVFIQFSESNFIDFNNCEIIDNWLTIKTAVEKIPYSDFLEKWKNSITPSERDYVLNLCLEKPSVENEVQYLESPASSPEKYEKQTAHIDDITVASEKIQEKKTLQKKKSEAWDRHIKPFITEHWYMVAGLIMTILGASLLAYFTWDKHWLIRYTIMPGLLALFTFGIAKLGSWFERRSLEFKSTAALLRAAAVCLIPVNYAAIALLALDPDVTLKYSAVSVMCLIYIIIFGRGVYLWAEAIEIKLGKILSLVINFINLLIISGPLSLLITNNVTIRELIMRAGYYAGFIVIVFSIIFIKRNVLTKENINNSIVPWFIGASIAVTFIQVFLWSHWLLKLIPTGYAYSILCIFSGWLVFYIERYYFKLFPERKNIRGESFFGFTFIFLGLLLGFSEQYMRIAALVSAGIVWFYQAENRTGKIHYYISLTFVLLAFVSAGLLDGFPKSQKLNMLPAIGIGLFLCLVIFKIFTKKIFTENLEKILSAIDEYEGIVLFFTTLTAVLSQWNLKSNQYHTAFFLIIVLLLFSIKTYFSPKSRWVNTAMIIAALILPYIGCMNMNERFVYGNTLAFGLGVLSFLWLAIIKYTGSDLLRKSRTSIILIYGVIALTSMILRVIIERGMPQEFYAYRIIMDYSGPFIISAALIIASYYSRSLLPLIIVVAIISILFPELKTYTEYKFPFIEWGSGLGTAISGLLFSAALFYLRNLRLHADSKPADYFYKTIPFPLRRNDYSLFTIPVLFSALFFCCKIDTHILLTKCDTQNINLKTTISFFITGINWILCALYLKRYVFSSVLTCLSVINFYLFFQFINNRIFAEPKIQYSVLMTGLTATSIYFLFFYLKKNIDNINTAFLQPLKFILKYSSYGITIFIMLLLFKNCFYYDSINFLSIYLIFQIMWHTLEAKSRHNAGAYICYWFIIELLICRIGYVHDKLFSLPELHYYIYPVISAIITVQLALLLFEYFTLLYQKAEPIIIPFNTCSIINLFITALLVILYILTVQIQITYIQQAVILGILLLTARNQGSSILVLLTAVLLYLFLHIPVLNNLNIIERLKILFDCRDLALLSLGISLVALIIKTLYTKYSDVISGKYRIIKSNFDFFLLTVFSITIAVAAVIRQTVIPALRYDAVFLMVPYISFISVYVLWLINRDMYFLLILSNIFLTIANIHAVNIYAGIPYLSAKGLSAIHIICLGISSAIIINSILKKIENEVFFPSQYIDKFITASAGLILFLLTFNYFSDSNLEGITNLRFIASGVLAYSSGLIFRNSAKSILRTNSGVFKIYNSFYHFGILMALWCLFLMIPALRNPGTAFIALGLPIVYFYLRAESGKNNIDTKMYFDQYRDSAVIISFILLFFYLNRVIFQMILFPDQKIQTIHYHYHAPVVITISLLLLRLRGLGANYWSSFYGGLGFITGVFFLITFIPGLSPFDKYVPACWVAIALYHLFSVLTINENPVRILLKKIMDLNDNEFSSISIVWSRWVAAAANIFILIGLSEYQSDSFSAAPLIFGAASISLHQGYFDKLEINFYQIIACIQILTALHFDFIAPSYMPKQYILWIILTAWAALVIINNFMTDWRNKISTVVFKFIFILTAIHILYHNPWTNSGLLGFLLLWILTAFMPVSSKRESFNAEEKIWSLFLLFAPVWLAFFSQTGILSLDFRSHFVITNTDFFNNSWQFNISYFFLFCSAVFAELCSNKWKHFIDNNFNSNNQTLFHCALKWFSISGHKISLWIISILLALLTATGILYYNSVYNLHEIIVCLFLWVGLSVFWFVKGKEFDSYPANILAQFCIACFFTLIRRQINLTTDFWKIEYDVWCSLGVSCVLAGVKRILYKQNKSLQISFMLTLIILPVFAMIWTIVHKLGVNITLLVIGLNSMIYAYYGNDDHESPFNIAAVIGFVIFLILLLWTKLEIHYLHSYVIPVAIGTLAISQLLKKSLSHETLTIIRVVSIAAIAGCSGYYALIDPAHPIIFNFTMIIICIALMISGSFFRIKSYLFIGFCGLIIDVFSIFYKIISGFDRTYKMTTMGILLLLLGATLVIGAAYYKTNKNRIDEFINKIRETLNSWE